MKLTMDERVLIKQAIYRARSILRCFSDDIQFSDMSSSHNIDNSESIDLGIMDEGDRVLITDVIRNHIATADLSRGGIEILSNLATIIQRGEQYGTTKQE